MNLLSGDADFRRAFSNPFGARLLVAYGIDRVSAWLVTLTAIVLAFNLTGSIGVAAAVILVQVLARALVVLATGQDSGIRPVLVTLSGIVRVGAIAGLVLFDSHSDAWWAILLVGVASMTNGVIETGYSNLIPLLGQRKDVPKLNKSIGKCEQLSAIAGPLLTALTIVAFDERGTFALAAILSYVSLTLFRRIFLDLGTLRLPTSTNAGSRNPFTPEDWRLPDEVKGVIIGLIAMAVLGIVVRLALLDVVVDDPGVAVSVYALLIALVGVGALVGPMPVDRILGHFPVTLILAGGVCAVAVAAGLLSVGAPLFIVIPALLATGIVIITLDIAASVTLRRAVPEWATSEVNDAVIRLVLTGQVIAVLAVLVLERAWDVRLAALIVCALCAMAVGVHFLRTGMRHPDGRIARSDPDKGAPNESTS